MHESIQLVIDSLPYLLKGAVFTLQLSIGGMFFGLVLGFILALMRLSPLLPVRWLARFYISIFRGTPLIAQLFMIYYGLPQLGISMEAWTAGLLALVIYHGAYFFEILRSQRRIFSAGYIEAAVSQGFSRYKIFQRIILPNIFSSALPLMGNQLIICLKDTAFLCIITVQEITAAANSVQSTYFIPFNAFIVAIALYWGISILLELLIKRLSQYGNKRGMTHA